MNFCLAAEPRQRSMVCIGQRHTGLIGNRARVPIDRSSKSLRFRPVFAVRRPAAFKTRIELGNVHDTTAESFPGGRVEFEINGLTFLDKLDVLLIDFERPHLTPLHNVYANIVYSAHGSDVHTAIVNGNILMEDREVKTLNEHKVTKEAQETAFKLIAH